MDTERLPPTPRGYTKITLPAGLNGAVALTCDKCGCLVLMTKTHNDYHKKNG
jgi:hypothetical protein